MKIHLINLLTVLNCSFAYSATHSKTFQKLKYKLGIDWVQDENINDNFNEQSRGYASPFASLKYTWHKKNLPINFDFQYKLRYENYVQERSSLLASPLGVIKGQADYKLLKSIRLISNFSYAEYLNPDFKTVKNHKKWGLVFKQKGSYHKLKGSYRLDFENYGQSAQDGNTHWLGLETQLYNDLSQHSKVSYGGFITHENRRSRGALYTYIKNKWGASAKLNYYEFAISSKLYQAQKEYAFKFTPKASSTEIPKQNLYLGGGLRLKYTLAKRMDITLAWNSERLNSNLRGSSYDDSVWSFGFSYFGLFKFNENSNSRSSLIKRDLQ
jgi:hypothetical protein